MAFSTVTTASTSMRGVFAAKGPPPGFPVLGMPQLMDTTPAPQSYSLLAHAGVGRGWRIQATESTARPQAPAASSLHQEWPTSAIQQQATSGRHEAAQATPYQQQVFPPQQSSGVRFALATTKVSTAPSTDQSQEVAARGRQVLHQRTPGQVIPQKER